MGEVADSVRKSAGGVFAGDRGPQIVLGNAGDTIRSACRPRPPATTNLRTGNKDAEPRSWNRSTVSVPSRRDERSARAHPIRDGAPQHEVPRAAEILTGVVPRNAPTGIPPWEPKA